MFQSTPAGIPAGDEAALKALEDQAKFQSTPAGIPAGDVRGAAPCGPRRIVSIHARRNSSGRRGALVRGVA